MLIHVWSTSKTTQTIKSIIWQLHKWISENDFMHSSENFLLYLLRQYLLSVLVPFSLEKYQQIGFDTMDFTMCNGRSLHVNEWFARKILLSAFHLFLYILWIFFPFLYVSSLGTGKTEFRYATEIFKLIGFIYIDSFFCLEFWKSVNYTKNSQY